MGHREIGAFFGKVKASHGFRKNGEPPFRSFNAIETSPSRFAHFRGTGINLKYPFSCCGISSHLIHVLSHPQILTCSTLTSSTKSQQRNGNASFGKLKQPFHDTNTDCGSIESIATFELSPKQTRDASMGLVYVPTFAINLNQM